MLTDQLRDDGKITTGMQAYSWFVWTKNKQPITLCNWLDIDEFVYRKGDNKHD